MTTAIIASYNDAISVSFRPDAWFNATQVASCFSKKPDDWLRTSDTKEYIKAISQICDFEENQLISIKRGAPNNGGGTWMHPKLGIPFARWLDPKFGVWCDMQVEKILYVEPQNAVKLIEPATLTASEQQTLSELVHKRVAEYGPNTGKALAEIWSRVHRKFRVAKYDQLPREQLSDAIAYVMAMEIKTGKADLLEGPEPIAPARVRNYTHIREHMDNLRDWAQRALPESARTPFLNNLDDLNGCLVSGWTEMDEALLHLSLATSYLRRWRDLH